jgi:hypothetical protein
MASEVGEYALSGLIRDDDQMDAWSNFEEWKKSEEIRNRLGIVIVFDVLHQGTTGFELVETWQLQGKEVEAGVGKCGRS